jgi:transcriptional regulator with XRE-family HTH domain
MSNNRFPNFAEYFNSLLREKEYRKTQTEVAAKFGIKQAYLSKISRGMQLPSEELADKFGEAWGISDFAERVIEARREDTMKVLDKSSAGKNETSVKDEQIKIIKTYIIEMAKSSRGRKLLRKFSNDSWRDVSVLEQTDEILSEIYDSLQ